MDEEQSVSAQAGAAAAEGQGREAGGGSSGHQMSRERTSNTTGAESNAGGGWEAGANSGGGSASEIEKAGFAHVRAPDHAPAGKRSMVENGGAESERSLRRRKFGVFLDHGVLESVKRAQSSELSQASRDGKDRLEAGNGSGRAVHVLMQLKGNHSLRSPPNSDGSAGSVGISFLCARTRACALRTFQIVVSAECIGGGGSLRAVRLERGVIRRTVA